MAISNAGIGSCWFTRNLQTLVSPCFRASVYTRAQHTSQLTCTEMCGDERREERMRERIRATRSLVNVPCRTVSYRIYPRPLSTEKMLRYLPDPIREKLHACRRLINGGPRKREDICAVISLDIETTLQIVFRRYVNFNSNCRDITNNYISDISKYTSIKYVGSSSTFYITTSMKGEL